MASSWGDSWGSSWGDSWGIISTPGPDITGRVTLNALTGIISLYPQTSVIKITSESALNIEAISMSAKTKTQSSTEIHTTQSQTTKITMTSLTPERSL